MTLETQELVREQHRAPIIGPGSPLIFMHIPKSGGMSLFASLSKVLGGSIADLYNHSTQNLVGAPLLIRDRTISAYAGHFSFGLHQWLARPAYYASFVREPVSRMVSLYYFLLGHWQSMNHQFTHKKLFGSMRPPEFHLDFADWLIEKPERPERFFSCPSAELDNGMVRRFSGYGLNPQPCPAEALSKAKDNIEAHFSFVGLVDRYAESLDQMATLFGLSDLKENRVNVSKRKPKVEQPLSTNITTKIRDMNKLDQALYEWVRENFDRRKADAKLIPVMGFGRTDYKNLPLWRGVGGGRGRALKEAG